MKRTEFWKGFGVGFAALLLLVCLCMTAFAAFKKVKLDWDDGRPVYEVEFYAGAMEYEYEIDAWTGAIISREIERRH